MNQEARRGVTRGYVLGLIAATLIVVVALVVAGWGGLSLLLDRGPVVTEEVPRWAAPITIVVALAALAWGLWLQAVALLKGQRAPAWGIVFSEALGAYLIWCLGGILAGMSVDETWLSPFAAMAIPVWGVCTILFWAVLARRVYTDRPVPKWPWEKRESPGEGPNPGGEPEGKQ